MSRWEALAFNALHGLLAATGFAYLYMKYALETDDPFAVVNHAWQPAALAAHVVLAPLGMLIFGVMLRSHVLKQLTMEIRSARPQRMDRAAELRRNGGVRIPASGRCRPSWLRALVVIHVATSTSFILGYSVHLFLAGERRRRC